MIWLTLIAAVVLAAVHVGAGKIRFLRRVPRSRWLSGAGGVSIAYVFVHMFPELSEQQNAFEEIEAVGFVEHHVYLIALIGFAAFYGLERMVRRTRGSGRRAAPAVERPERPPMGMFWLHVGSFAAYNGLIGYLLVHREQPGAVGLGLYGLAMVLHFVVNDYGLHEHHREAYRRFGRWLLGGAVLAGWLVGVATAIDEAALGVLFAFLAGGVILNVIKEELPEERESHFSAFALGAGGYAALLLSLAAMG